MLRLLQVYFLQPTSETLKNIEDPDDDHIVEGDYLLIKKQGKKNRYLGSSQYTSLGNVKEVGKSQNGKN